MDANGVNSTGRDDATGSLWRAKEAASYLAISERHLWTLTQRGEIPAVRLGDKCVRYDLADLRAVIDARKQKVRA